MVRKKKKHTLPTVKLAIQLLDEIDRVASTRHPEEERQQVRNLARAYGYVERALEVLQYEEY